ncbi:MAG: CAP domain-containing protein, partial [Candidatus Erginobacter occultus]|nr:CAP domain-containing protein [Candidatus Erginobacter occultus]
MKSQYNYAAITVLILLGLLLLPPATAAGEGALFYEADDFLTEAEQIGVIGAVRYRAVFVEPSRLGEISPDGELEAAPEVTLNLFADTTFQAVLEKCYPSIGEGWVWEGKLQSPHSGTAVIAFTDRTLAAEVEADGRVIQVRHDGGPVHLVRELETVEADLLRSGGTAVEMDVYNRTNQERASRGIYCLAWNDLLRNSARGHSQAMGQQDFFDHDNPNTGSTPGSRMTAAGYNWNSCAENIAAGNSTAAATMQQWMDSTGHRNNILNQVRCDLGVGYYYLQNDPGTYQYHYYWTQNFGRRMGVSTCPYVPPPVPTTTTRAPLQLYAGDFNGDSISDIAIFRPSTGLWSIRGVGRYYFGRSGDIPVPADYNGDGRADIAIFRPSNGLWSVRGVTRFYFGKSGDYPIPMNYRAGYVVAGIFRPSTGLWSFRNGGRLYFGKSGDIPVPGPWKTRSGKWGLVYPGIFRPSNGLWSIQGVTRFYFGSSGDIPVPGAYSTSSTEPWKGAIFRPSTGLWS